MVMMVDDTGWGELGCHGGGLLRGAPTPRLDRLASEVMQLLNIRDGGQGRDRRQWSSRPLSAMMHA